MTTEPQYPRSEIEANIRAVDAYVRDAYAKLPQMTGEPFPRPAAPVAQEPPAPTECNHPRHVIPTGEHVCYCGTTGCCGDLEHAPGSAQEPADPPMTVERAIQVVAAEIVAQAMDNACAWEDYPEIGEGDWNAVESAVTAMMPPVLIADFQAAYALLESRANGGQS